ncbi:hypothetical protein Bca4012_044319 [Brassica carinata]|uniref:BnaC09g53030D protein n=3 Tax=Brassica TaxID=3705 RepID=A0A078JBJ7_BRANA|nr:BnaC09g53030D [Brassica napus]VDD31577.1 unnamed protein product [Brassica oleracea]
MMAPADRYVGFRKTWISLLACISRLHINASKSSIFAFGHTVTPMPLTTKALSKQDKVQEECCLGETNAYLMRAGYS